MTVIVNTGVIKGNRRMYRIVIAGLLAAVSGMAQADRQPNVEVNVPPEVFNSGGQRTQPCQQCCIYQNQNYSEGAVIKTEGILLQCQRDPNIMGTNPLVWRRVTT